MKPQRFQRDAAPTRAAARAALTGVLTMRPSLDNISLESLERSYNLPAREIAGMVEAEKARREMRS